MVYLKHEISNPLADHFNLSFISGVFPSVLKIVKVVAVYRKDSKSGLPLNYRPIFLLSNRRAGVREKGGMTTEYEFMYLKCPSFQFSWEVFGDSSF